MIEIGLSMVVGAIIGAIMMLAIRFESSESHEYSLIISISGIILSVAISQIGIFGQHLSIILTPMVAGLVFANTIEREKLHRTVRTIDNFNPFILVAFFTIAGAHLDLGILFSSSSSTYNVALFGGEDGLDFYRIIISGAAELLNEKFIVAFEHAYDKAKELKKIIKKHFKDVQIIQKKDMQGKDRMTFIVKK